MGQKTHPVGYRLGISQPHSVAWYAERDDFKNNLIQDLKIRELLYKAMPERATLANVVIQRTDSRHVKVTMSAVRIAVILGAKGENLQRIEREIATAIGLDPQMFSIEIVAAPRPETSAALVAENVAAQLEKRVMFRRAMRRALSSATQKGAQGIKIAVAGRLGGAEIARTEWYREGRVPLHTLRAKIDYATAEAHTTYGVIGVKVWVYSGDVDEAPLVVDLVSKG